MMGTNNVIDLSSFRSKKVQKQVANDNALRIAGLKYKLLLSRDRYTQALKRKLVAFFHSLKQGIFRTLRFTSISAMNIGMFYVVFFGLYELGKGIPSPTFFASLVALCLVLHLAKKGLRKGYNYLIANW